MLGCVGISGFYLHRARQRGVGTRVQPFVAFGVLLVVLAMGSAFGAIFHPAVLAQSLHLESSQTTNVLFRIASPAGVVIPVFIGEYPLAT
ncbi:MAG: hypothetical protein ACYDAQ_17120 [Mycobacteriales bacterium]